MEKFEPPTSKPSGGTESKRNSSEQSINPETQKKPEKISRFDVIAVSDGFEARLPSAVDMETGLVCGTSSEFFQTKKEAEQAVKEARARIDEIIEIISLEKSYDKNFFRIENTPDGGFIVYIPGLIDLKTGNLVGGSTGKNFNTWNEARDYYLEHREQAERITHRPIMEIQLASDEKIAFSEFSGFNPDVAPSKTTHKIPESILNYMTKNGRLDGSGKSADTYQHTIEEEGWETKLFSFLTSYLQNYGTETATELGIENLDSLTPKQAVELSTQIVIDLTKYKHSDVVDVIEPQLGKLNKKNLKTEADKSTALQLLQEGLNNNLYSNPEWEGNGICRNFAGVVKAVFEALKANQTQFSRLNNTYCLYESGHEYDMKKKQLSDYSSLESGHAWNTFITVSKEGTANASIVDATWAERNLETKQIERFDFTLDRMEPLVFAAGEGLSSDNPNKLEDLKRILSYYLMAIESPPDKSPRLDRLNAEEFLASRALDLMRLQGVPEELPPVLIEKLSKYYQQMHIDKLYSTEIETLYKVSQKYPDLNIENILSSYIERRLHSPSLIKGRSFLVDDNDLQAIIFDRIKSDKTFDDYLNKSEFRFRVRKVSPHLLPDFSPTTRPEDLEELNYLINRTQGLKHYRKQSSLQTDEVDVFFKKIRTDFRSINPTRYDQEIKDLDDHQLASRYNELKEKLAYDSEINSSPQTNSQEDPRSPEQIKLAEKQKKAAEVLNFIGQNFPWNPAVETVYGPKTFEWVETVSKALKEETVSDPKGNEDNEDLIEPMSHLAALAFNRSDFEPGSENAQNVNLAYKTFNSLGERYDINVPITLRPILKKLESVAYDLEEISGEHGWSQIVKNYVESVKSGKMDNLTLIVNIDADLEIKARGLHTDAQGIAAAEYGIEKYKEKYDENTIEEFRKNTAALLPILKTLSDLRDNLCRKEFGARKTPSEIYKLHEQELDLEQ